MVKKRSFSAADLIGFDAADCRRRSKAVTFALGKQWKSPNDFIAAARKKFAWFKDVEAAPDWQAIIAMIIQIINEKNENKAYQNGR